MRFHVLTLFPGAFQGPFQHSMLEQASRNGFISIQLTDIRDYTHDAHKTADDYQFGGGPGMVMKPEPVFEAVEDVLGGYSTEERAHIPVVLLSPQGEAFTQVLAEELSQSPAIVLICGHYAGVDERIRQGLATREISLGDFILTGGELPAMMVVDAVSRLVPGVVGSMENVTEDSISSGVLQHPLYTRPFEYRDMAVPDILRSGHHAEIETWRRQESLKRTLNLRPDLLKSARLSEKLTAEDLKYLQSLGYEPEDD
ncbi:MAG TPA: tRNA (guanosine(37)-N1)-methyltransferase TrmD [Dehalococcoidia bacterium]|nr:tRNA (guanosine(37)-N1)-methyltransferase TrmD [Gemmatimonadota bacterium]HIN07025.1 tRNA (guanosine(37)-N1)-methyltransferase TrmD [Dehalococcoidia bacterium]